MTKPYATSLIIEDDEDKASNSARQPTIGDVIAARINRRELAGGLLGVGAISLIMRSSLSEAADARPDNGPAFRFDEVTAGVDADHHVAAGYRADILIRWGDPVLADAPPFDPMNQSAEAQAKQFGYNSDYIGFLPIDGQQDRALLVVNHEYSIPEMMFDELAELTHEERMAAITAARIDIEMMAHGGSVIEIEKTPNGWKPVPGSPYARRITGTTPCRISGPATGHDRMKTNADPQGERVLGMLNNCAGGMTPWGTWLTCEENFNGYFWNKEALNTHADAEALDRYGVPSEWYAWGRYHDRFDIGKEPNEANRFGWVVEIDPFDPEAMPVKRTALGRFKHEGAGNIVNKDGRYVVYQGDDQAFEYVYKFVTRDKVDLTNRQANHDLLDHGTLYVARFDSDETGRWLPLVHGTGPLTAENGFNDQGDVVIHARQAARLLGATPMDRPEDVDVNPKDHAVYVILTNNKDRKLEDRNDANPREVNHFGHIIEIHPDDDDHAAETFRWDILVKCGDPAVAAVGASFNPLTSRNGWFGMPDNSAIDAEGRLWIATDGNNATTTGRTDGLWSMETNGARRGTSRLFYRVPVGAELCGPCPTPDLETFFVAVQHPGDSVKGEPPSNMRTPSTRWPDFNPNMPPRPSVVAIRAEKGGKIAR